MAVDADPGRRAAASRTRHPEHPPASMDHADPFDTAVGEHDAALAARGLVIWVGCEPTFTDRFAQTPPWLWAALGGDKQARAARLLEALVAGHPGGLVLRSVGRHYDGEDEPRWSFGWMRYRDGAPLWRGPPDPLLAGAAPASLPDLDAWAAAFVQACEARALPSPAVTAPDAAWRHVEGVHGTADGTLAFGLAPVDGVTRAVASLPAFREVDAFLATLGCIETSARQCGITRLVVGGRCPPVDARVELTTVTPDPAVVEVNSAPDADARGFLARSRATWAAAAAAGLHPLRLYFDGTVADSGGGGQLTLGGASPGSSVFVSQPALLPRLVRFVVGHPSLSYRFCHDFVGGHGQSARADERGADAFEELALALERLDRLGAPDAGTVAASLSPLLRDAAGNAHRSEINIEKFHDAEAPLRGMQGLVEFRALRMQHSPERATALACLLRAVVALLATSSRSMPLIDWGPRLHRRFALPFYLEQDLEQVLDELQLGGFGLGAPIVEALRREEFRHWCDVALPGAVLELRRALEFWPLVGDAAGSEQQGSSRLVDSSTARVELRLRAAAGPGPDWRGWQVAAAGIELPLLDERDRHGQAVRIAGLRYRAFVPRRGLHPGLAAQLPLALCLRHPALANEHVLTLHGWRPDGQAYDGLPADLDEAAARRAARVVHEERARPPDAAAWVKTPPGTDACCVDLRRFA